MTSLVTMTTTPAKETLFHVLSNGLCEMFLAGSIDFIYFFLDFLTFFELFFCKKKYLLVGATSMLWTGQWISESVRDVCMSHQSDRIYYKQPIKFLVLKVNGI